MKFIVSINPDGGLIECVLRFPVREIFSERSGVAESLASLLRPVSVRKGFVRWGEGPTVNFTCHRILTKGGRSPFSVGLLSFRSPRVLSSPVLLEGLIEVSKVLIWSWVGSRYFYGIRNPNF